MEGTVSLALVGDDMTGKNVSVASTDSPLERFTGDSSEEVCTFDGSSASTGSMLTQRILFQLFKFLLKSKLLSRYGTAAFQ